MSRLSATRWGVRLAPAGFYQWQHSPVSDRQIAGWLLTERIREIFERSDQTYGSPRVHAELRLDHGVGASNKRVARLMREHGFRLVWSTRRRRRPAMRRNAANDVPGQPRSDRVCEFGSTSAALGGASVPRPRRTGVQGPTVKPPLISAAASAANAASASWMRADIIHLLRLARDLRTSRWRRTSRSHGRASFALAGVDCRLMRVW
jgi:hypothetical protein